MSDLTHLFHVGQKVNHIHEEEFTGKVLKEPCYVKETYPDHIICHNIKFDFDFWVEEGMNIGEIYPEYNERMLGL